MMVALSMCWSCWLMWGSSCWTLSWEPAIKCRISLWWLPSAWPDKRLWGSANQKIANTTSSIFYLPVTCTWAYLENYSILLFFGQFQEKNYRILPISRTVFSVEGLLAIFCFTTHRNDCQSKCIGRHCWLTLAATIPHVIRLLSGQ